MQPTDRVASLQGGNEKAGHTQALCIVAGPVVQWVHDKRLGKEMPLYPRK
ncbi:hypothetical protein SAMN02927897_01128 [Kosakonia sacchari]|uniref:Uncharacterized protein n=1 Tax=Kosakonia sacchari TaxID=1158459 RepID=A0A1G4XKM8_9ENTR|nr:hypothetical protein SAMN02927897_01128 [Kosakonia sacchari]